MSVVLKAQDYSSDEFQQEVRDKLSNAADAIDNGYFDSEHLEILNFPQMSAENKQMARDLGRYLKIRKFSKSLPFMDLKTSAAILKLYEDYLNRPKGVKFGN